MTGANEPNVAPKGRDLSAVSTVKGGYKMVKRVKQIIVVTVIWAAVVMFAQVVAAQSGDAQRISAVKQPYDFNKWAGKTKVAYARLASMGADIDLSDLPGVTMVREDPIERRPDDSLSRTYIFRPAGNERGKGGQIVVRLMKGKKVMDAHTALLNMLLGCAFGPLPRGETKGLEVGDICFTGLNRVASSATFVRNNVLVDISSGDFNYDIRRIANFIDKAILKASTSEDEKLSLALHCTRTEIKAGENLRLNLLLENLLNKEVSISPLQPFGPLNLVVESRGVVLPSQRKVSIRLAPNVKVQPGGVLLYDTDLFSWFPEGLNEGVYQLHMLYRPERDSRDVVLRCNSIRLEVKPRTKEQEKVYQDFL
ncbi:MAG: hypothetical protein QGD94_11650, partial [Planctomycetia bacterium]|nr:hypothetical protein [Planctomycetia bacterium]